MNTQNSLHLSVLATVAALSVSSFAGAQEYRCCWVSRYEWPSATKTTAQNNINTIMSTLKTNNFNAVMFQVRGTADVHYPSAIDPWTSTYSWTSPGWDPLAYALQKAHDNGLEFHAYFNTHTMTTSGGPPPANTTPQHIYNTHGPSATGSNCWVVCDATGTPAVASDGYYWISPGNPDASLHTRKAAMELLQNYAVDGIHFDRIRVPSSTFSHDAASEARFAGEGNPDNLPWADFMRRCITDDLRRIYGQAAMVRPAAKISAAPIGINQVTGSTLYQGTGSQAYSNYYQDTWRWMKEGCLDFAIPQIYWEVGSTHPYEKILTDWLNNRGERLIVPGSTTNTGSKTSSALQLEITTERNQGASGWCVFSYGSMSSYWSDLKTNKFPTAATVPVLPWKSSPTKGILTGYVKDKNGNPVTDAKVVMADDTLKNFAGTAPYNHLTGADGFYAILNVAPGAHQLTFSKNGSVSVVKTGISATAGQVTQTDAQFTQDAPPPVAVTAIVNSRGSAGYTELTGSWADTSSASTATGAYAGGGRYTASATASAKFTPNLAAEYKYDVYVTLGYGSNNNSPGAGWSLTVNGSAVAGGTVNLTNTNGDIVNKWYKLASFVPMPAGSNTTITFTNNNAASSGTQRFVMSGVKFEPVGSTPVNLSTFELE